MEKVIMRRFELPYTRKEIDVFERDTGITDEMLNEMGPDAALAQLNNYYHCQKEGRWW